VTESCILVHPIWDHDEWTRLTRDAEGRIFVAQGFIVRDETRAAHVTDPLEVEGALGVVAEREGWPLADVGGPIVSSLKQPADGCSAQMKGGWWAVVPIDYLEGATYQDLEFHADYEDRKIVFWAFEAHVERFGGPKLPEFDHKVEFALWDKDLYVHDEHPDALQYTWGLEERSAR
jgi:hypothetical protein